MSAIPVLHSIIPVAFDALLYCLAEGCLLALAIAVALRLIPQKSSRTAFVIWFSALLASAFLPLVGVNWSREVGSIGAPRAAITLPLSIALYTVVAWAALAFAGLLRVMAGVWHLRRLRRGCQPVCVAQLGPELGKTIEQFWKIRSVSILSSHAVQVPTAIGFMRPAVIIPAWMIEEGPSDELKHVVLHELAHLRRRDDWTNLVQKIVGALLFFHPAVWWMQRELSAHREMACDDAVLEETGSPHAYAECLARVAEKSFLRRQVALAQAAVSRMHQLTRRVSRILDPNRRRTTQVWKPAIPAVVTLALLSGVSGSWAPSLVKLQDGKSASASVAQRTNDTSGTYASVTPGDRISNVRAWPVGMKAGAEERTGSRPLFVPAKHNAARPVPAKKAVRPKRIERTPMMLAASKTPAAPVVRAAEPRSEFVLVIETRQTVTAGANGWQVSVEQLRWLVPVSRIHESVPSKT
jgi:beta-lactamase regulating signal transducer with metallopeptidase domain